MHGADISIVPIYIYLSFACIYVDISDIKNRQLLIINSPSDVIMQIL